MASSLLAAMGITKPANSSFQPESFANADKEIQQPVVNVGPPAQEGKQIQTQTRPQPQPHQDPDEVPSEQEFDFNTILQEQEDMTTETVLHQRYVFYCLKRGKGAVSEIYIFLYLAILHSLYTSFCLHTRNHSIFWTCLHQKTWGSIKKQTCVQSNYEEGVRRLGSFQTVWSCTHLFLSCLVLYYLIYFFEFL